MNYWALRAREPLTRLLFEQTAGLPVLLEQLVIGLRDTGQLSPEVLSHLAPGTRLDVPAGVQEQLRYVIEALPAEVREVLFVATLGAGGDTETLTQLLNADGPAYQCGPARGSGHRSHGR